MRRVATVVMVLMAGGFLLAACGGGTPSSSSVTGSSGTAPKSAPATSGSANPPAAVTMHVWFLDQQHASTGQEPLFVPVARQLQPPALAAAALDALFAGPTAAEQADGLRFVASGATGYSHLHIADGVASVTLEGGCSSGGSTMTVAGEIVPTLKQFSSVDHVKIYAPDGSTEEPTGATDSIPTCLEP